MRYRLEILLAGRVRDELGFLETLLRSQSDINVTTRVIVNGHADPLYGVSPLPDALVLLVSDHWEAELSALCERPAAERPPLLVVGPKGNVELIRVAMRAGARDFFSPPIDDGEITQFIRQLARDRLADPLRQAARLTAVVNAKGGSGASMVAANLAHILAERDRRSVLMDLDVQFGSLPLYFNLSPRNGLVGALEAADSLDGVALEGYVQTHDSGLDLLASSPEDMVTIAEVPESRVELLLQVLAQSYDEVVVDLPRWISGPTAMVLERADRILVVMEQSVTHLRDAQRLRDILRHELHLSTASVMLVVNRYDKRNAVGLADIREALPGLPLLTLPNDFRRVSHSINVGVPLREAARKAPVTRKLVALAKALDDDPAQARETARGKWSLLGWARRD
ncbi:Flp pilus assembly protein [Litchfieldella qijiaojingensis]|uniref:Flp pilus assembly protein n=1 Tax=Litchfieldella qijiaojingensis TaxID=980347 RepID=A0ABQ2YIZ8_9GAMM|nr:AAA family ATPase [Halomonas qijiaojingensis]GGX82950.1 Flp pilus assembly protein [Halomonas qijiaojingensis]